MLKTLPENGGSLGAQVILNGSFALEEWSFSDPISGKLTKDLIANLSFHLTPNLENNYGFSPALLRSFTDNRKNDYFVFLSGYIAMCCNVLVVSKGAFSDSIDSLNLAQNVLSSIQEVTEPSLLSQNILHQIKTGENNKYYSLGKLYALDDTTDFITQNDFRFNKLMNFAVQFGLGNI